MEKIGIIFNDNDNDNSNSNEIYLDKGKERNFILRKIEKSTELIDLTGLIIVLNKKKNIVDSINWLVECKKYPKLLVWFFSEEYLTNESELIANLGADIVISQNENLDSFFISISNTLKKINGSDFKHETVNELININNNTVLVNDNQIELTRKEFLLFSILYEHINNTVSYKTLNEKIWPVTVAEDQFRIANLVFGIREKVKHSKHFELKTIRGIGYMLKIR